MGPALIDLIDESAAYTNKSQGGDVVPIIINPPSPPSTCFQDKSFNPYPA